MKEQELAGFRFFRVLLPGFSEKMLLPHDSIKLIGNKKSTNTAIFLSPIGTVWQVNLYNEMDGVYVGGRGWRDLTLANNLGNGYFLVLHYKGNMVFSFRAFNLSTCEITYSSVTQKDERKESMSNNVVDENSDIVGEPIENSRKKKKTEGLSHAHDQGLEIRRHRTLKARFEVTIKECNLSRRRLCVLIPSGFTKSCDLLTKVSKLTLRDPQGVVWPIGLVYYEGSHEVYISKGWSAFARANEVKIGDRCIFELLLKCQNQVTMSVKILNNIPVVRLKKLWESSTALTKENVKILKNTSVIRPSGVQDNSATSMKDEVEILENMPVITPVKLREVSTTSINDEVKILINSPIIRPMKSQEGSTALMKDEVEILRNLPVIRPRVLREGSTTSMKAEVEILKNSLSFRPMKLQDGCTTSMKGKKLSSGASFEATITDYNVYRNYLHIPLKFMESNGLGKCSELALQDLQGRRWVVSLSRRYRGGRITAATRMSKGWKNFASIKRLRKGDKCVFELASRGKKHMVVLQVRIVRRLKANE